MRANQETPPVTATEGRRHRPSTKRKLADTPSERSASTKSHGNRGSKITSKNKMGTRIEDKRESPDEMVTDARPRNRTGDRDTQKAKGRATHALESTAPHARPSRKSTRRGANHIKPDSQQRRRATRAARSPKVRHAGAAG